MYLPEYLQDIIYSFIHQLKYKKVMDELKIVIKYNYISPYFSEIMYLTNYKIVTYYHNTNSDNLLLMYKNDINEFNCINNNTKITIIRYL